MQWIQTAESLFEMICCKKSVNQYQIEKLSTEVLPLKLSTRFLGSWLKKNVCNLVWLTNGKMDAIWSSDKSDAWNVHVLLCPYFRRIFFSYSLEHPEKTKSFLQCVTDCWKVCRRCLYDDAINGLPLLNLRYKQMGLFWAWKRIQWVGMATVGPTHMNAQLPRRNRRDFLMTLLFYLSAPSINSSLNSRYVMATNLQNGPSIWYAVQHSSNWNKRMQYGVLSWS